DATGSLIAPALHAWRLEDRAYIPWVADDDGWWRSRSLGISFQPTQPFMTIRDREGRQLSLPHQAFAREYTLEHVEHELAEAQRRDMGGSLFDYGTTRHDEFRVIQAAHRAGVLVPEPLACTDDLLGRAAFVMELIDGETIGRRLVSQPQYAAIRPVLIEQLAT